MCVLHPGDGQGWGATCGLSLPQVTGKVLVDRAASRELGSEPEHHPEARVGCVRFLPPWTAFLTRGWASLWALALQP